MTPAYKLLAAELRRAILAGEFPAHRRLPTEEELAAQHRLSRQTVRQAFAELVSESLVYRVRGRGTFAAPPALRGTYLRSLGSVEDLLAMSSDSELEIMQPFERTTNIDAAARLELASDEVMKATFRRLHEKEPFSVTTAFLPIDLGRRLQATGALPEPGRRTHATVIAAIEQALKLPIAGAYQSVTAVTIPDSMAGAIDCDPGAPALRLDRLYFDRDARKVELSITYANPSRYSYRIELRRGGH